MQFRVVDSENNIIGIVVDNIFYTCSQLEGMFDLDQGFTDDILPIIPCSTVESIKKAVRTDILIDNYIDRSVTAQFNDWGSGVLYVYGAPGVGKTTEVLNYAYDMYDNVAYFSLAEHPELIAKLMSVLECYREDLCAKIADFVYQYLQSRFEANSGTVLIIDDIQLYPELMDRLCDVQEVLGCRVAVVSTGLISDYLGRDLVYPVEMTALSFKEFVKALGHAGFLESLKSDGSSNEAVYDLLWADYELYRQIGGFPFVVADYLQTKDIQNCEDVLNSIIFHIEALADAYFKLTGNEKVFSKLLCALARVQLRERNGANVVSMTTRLMQSSELSEVTQEQVHSWLTYLCNLGVIGFIDLLKDGQRIEGSRAYFRDVGVLRAVLNRVRAGTSIKEGLVTETFAYSELIQLYIGKDKLLVGRSPCFALTSSLELDFVVQTEKDIVGIEVKTTTSATKSLDRFLKSGVVNRGIVACKTHGCHVWVNKWRVPIYMVGIWCPYDNL